MIRDPVHGDVYLTREEIAVLDTREMQRLRGIEQLGTACLVYRGTVHTRFDRSIGTLHMAAKLIEAVNRSFELDPKGCVGVSEEEARVIRIAALVHDVTHGPFGHSIEDQDGILERHASAQRSEKILAAIGARNRANSCPGVWDGPLIDARPPCRWACRSTNAQFISSSRSSRSP